MDRGKARAGLDQLAGDSAGEITAKGQGARGKKAEGQRLKRSDIQRARETLTEMSPSQMIGMLGVAKSDLTPKQRAFAYNVAMGQTKAESYRQAYKRDATPATLAGEPYRVAADPRIAAEIEAYKLAQEAAKYRTPADLRALVIQTLVSQVISPDTPPAIRTQATKILGTVTEVSAFTERKESVIHHSSDKLRGQILEQIASLMGNTAQVVEGETVQDADSLLAELAPVTDTAGGDPTHTPPPTEEDGTPDGSIHTTPLK